MKPPNRLDACWDSLDARVMPTSARLSPARKTRPATLVIGATSVLIVCYVLAYAGLGFPTAPLSLDVVVAATILMTVCGFPIFISIFFRKVFLTTVTVYPLEGVACISWGPYHLRLMRKWILVGDGLWRVVPATIQTESPTLHNATIDLGSCSPAAMMRGFQTLAKADEDLGAINYPVWGLASDANDAPSSSNTRAVAWFRSFDDAQVALFAIVQAGGTAMPTETPQSPCVQHP